MRRARRRRRRRGGMYLVVMGVSMIVSVLGLSTLMLHRVQRRSSQNSDDVAQARLYAESAVTMGMLRIENDPNWRRNFPNGVWQRDVPIGRGTYTLAGIDPSDNDLADAPEDPVVLVGTGKQGAATQKVQITLAPANRGLGCLEVAMHAGDVADLKNATVRCDQTISANNQIAASGATVNCDVEAVHSIIGGTYKKAVTTGVDARQLPDSNTVFDYYKANGAWININDVVATPPPSPPSNFLANPGFESGVAPWQPWPGATCILESSTTPRHGGARSLHVRSRSSFQAGPVQSIAPFVISGVTYHCSGWVRMTGSDASAHFALDVSSSGGGAQSWLTDNRYCQKGTWTLVCDTITPTFAGTVNSATLRLETKSGDAVNDFYLDDAAMMASAQLPPGPNLLKKCYMEDDPLSDWYGKGCNIATSPLAYSGEQAICTTDRKNIADTFGQNVTSALQNGASYYAEAWIRQSSVWTNFRLMLKLQSTGDGTRSIALSPPVYAPADTYVKAYGEAVISWTGNLTLAEFYVENLSDSNNQMLLDDAVMIMSQPPPPRARTIFRQVLSPSRNPYGSGKTNPQGIYVIDCQGQTIHVERSRIVGTLVLLNAGAGSSIRRGPLNWSPAAANYPALLVGGDFNINSDNIGLTEAIEGVNYNPAGTPYAGLGDDSEQDDVYPSEIHGLVYASGDLSFSNRPAIHGVVVAHDDVLQVYGNLDLAYQPTLLEDPPPGFNGPEQIRVLLGSAKRVTD